MILWKLSCYADFITILIIYLFICVVVPVYDILQAIHIISTLFNIECI